MRSTLDPVLAGLILVAACGGDSGEKGILDVDTLPDLILRQDLRLGDAEDPDIGFSRIGGVTVDEDGNVYVVESLDQQIRAYDAAGNPLRVFGGEGEGPGEFRAAYVLGLVGDTLWVGDGRLNRITLFSLDGEVLRTLRQPGVSVDVGHGMTVRISGSFYAGSGRLLGATSGGSWSDELSQDTLETPWLVFSEDGSISDTLGHRRWVMDLGREVDVGGHTVSISPQPTLDSGPYFIRVGEATYVVERPIAASSDEGVLTLIRTDPQGDTILLRRYRYTPREYPAGFVDTLANRIAGGYRSSRPVDANLLERAARDVIELPPFMPPVQTYRTDDDGRIWLQREDVPGPTVRWLILEGDGMPVGHVDWPRNAEFRFSRGDIVWAVVPDDLDVPWLVRFRLERSSAP